MDLNDEFREELVKEISYPHWSNSDRALLQKVLKWYDNAKEKKEMFHDFPKQNDAVYPRDVLERLLINNEITRIHFERLVRIKYEGLKNV